MEQALFGFTRDEWCVRLKKSGTSSRLKELCRWRTVFGRREHGMAKAVSSLILQMGRRLGEDPRVRDVPDQELLRRFGAQQDQAAFRALLCRHGPMVLDVCGAVLGNEADAEDAFQAAFLVLARKAGSIRKTASLGSWLHGVAYRTALKARAQSAARRKHEARVPLRQAAEPDDLTWREVRQVLHEELSGLPERYRAPLVLCYLESATQEAAAARLGLAKSTLRERLERGRALLRTRLTRRGLGPAAVLVASAWPAAVAPAAVSVALVESTIQAARWFGAGQALPAGAASAQAVGLARRTLQAMTATKLASALVLNLSIGLICFGAALGLGLGREASRGGSPAELGQAVPERQLEADQPADNGRAEGTDTHGDTLPSGALARAGTVRFRHGGPVFSLTYLGRGKILASGGYVGRMWGEDAPGRIRLWDVETGTDLRQFQLQGVAQAAASPDGKILAGAGTADGTVFLWDVASGQEIRRLTGGRDYHGSRALAFSPDGKTLAATGPDPSVRVWDVETGKLLRTERTDEPVYQLAFSPDGKILAFSCVDRLPLRLFEVDGWKELFVVPGGHDVRSFAFSPDGKTLAGSSGLLGRADQDRPWIRQYELATGKVIRQFQGHRGPIHCVAFSPQGKTLASATSDGTIRLWEVATGKEFQALSGDRYTPGTLAFAPDSKSLASANADGLIRIWDLATGKILSPREGHQGVVSSVALSAYGKTLFSAGSDGTIRTWDTRTGKELRRLEGHQGPVVSVVVSPDGKLLASGSSDQTVRLWEVATGKELRRFPGSPLGLCPLRFSPDGKTLAASVFPDATVRLWEVATGKDRRLGSYSAGVACLAYSADGKTLAAGSLAYPSFGLWDTTMGEHRPWPIDKEAHQGAVTCAAFAPDGKTLFTGSGSDRVIRLWEVATGKERRRFVGHEAEVTSLALSPDGRTLAAAGYDQTVRLWEVTTGKERRRFVGHRGTVTSLAWSADGKTLASGSADGTALVWDVRKRE
jgi:RNA polymerase sigma factor (sigma-70 family)